MRGLGHFALQWQHGPNTRDHWLRLKGEMQCKVIVSAAGQGTVAFLALNERRGRDWCGLVLGLMAYSRRGGGR